MSATITEDYCCSFAPRLALIDGGYDSSRAYMYTPAVLGEYFQKVDTSALDVDAIVAEIGQKCHLKAEWLNNAAIE